MEDTNMNREARVERDTLVVIGDGARRRRTLIIGASLMLVALAIAFFFFSRGDSGDAATKGATAAPGAAGAGGPGGRGQVPAVSVIVPGRSSIARVVTASGALAAQRDQPIGAAGGGGRVTAVLVDAGSWVRQGQTLVTNMTAARRSWAAVLCPRPIWTASAPLATRRGLRFAWRRRSLVQHAPASVFSTCAHPTMG
jgi:hypothetical protein